MIEQTPLKKTFHSPSKISTRILSTPDASVAYRAHYIISDTVYKCITLPTVNLQNFTSKNIPLSIFSSVDVWCLVHWDHFQSSFLLVNKANSLDKLEPDLPLSSEFSWAKSTHFIWTPCVLEFCLDSILDLARENSLDNGECDCTLKLDSFCRMYAAPLQ